MAIAVVVVAVAVVVDEAAEEVVVDEEAEAITRPTTPIIEMLMKRIRLTVPVTRATTMVLHMGATTLSRA